MATAQTMPTTTSTYPSGGTAFPRARSAGCTTTNAAGGIGTFAVDDMTRARRFLVLGAEGGTYYATEQALAIENAAAIGRLLQAGRGRELVVEIAAVAADGRAAKQGPTLFALAMCARLGDLETRRAAYGSLAEICRIPTHLFMFIGFAEAMAEGTGWGRLQKKAVAGFYNGKAPMALAHQVTKYRNREGWTHLDVLRLAHVKTDSVGTGVVFTYVAKGFNFAAIRASAGSDPEAGDVARFLAAVEEAKTCTSVERIPRLVELIAGHNLVREHVPTSALGSVEIWRALLDKMPMTAMLRNLAKMTCVGLLGPLGDAVATVCRRLADGDRLRSARVHPFSVLLASSQYAQGRGDRGSLEWEPVPHLTAALDAAFYAAFSNVAPTGKRFVVALDVSGSMDSGCVNGARCLTPRVAAAAMAMVAMRTETKVHPLAFSSKVVGLAIDASMTLDEVLRATSRLPFGGTDCAQPMLWALEHKVAADVFVVYTDCETWAGDVSPADALQQYRAATGIEAKLIVVAMTSGGFTLADPTDSGMLDVVGFDAGAPGLMREFVLGRV
jgi:60 kDa SS-A/Ro ribonucleoprotein